MRKILMIMVAVILATSVSAQTGIIKTVSNAGFRKAIKSEKVQLVDVRTAEEFAEGYIYSGFTVENFDVKSEEFDKQILKLDKSRPVAVYCMGGKRSMIAAEKLAKQGFSVINLKDGYSRWKGKKVVAVSEVHAE